MMAKFKTHLTRLWKAAPVATAILILALFASAFFAVRSAIFWYHNPLWVEHSQEIAPWMTPRYVARSWDVPPRELGAAIGAPMPPPDGPISLRDLAALRDVPVEIVIAETKAFIASFHAKRDAGND